MPDADKPVDSNPTANASSVGKFVSPGILLFIDQLIVAAGGWAYWLVISKFATISEIGQATTIYSLVMLTTMITQLGLEYPLLRNSYAQRTRILGTIITLELSITAASIPIVLYVTNNLYEQSLQEFGIVTIGLLIATLLAFISRFALLGISDVRNVLIFDVIGTTIKFTTGYFLITLGFGTYGIIISFLLYTILFAAGTLWIVFKSFGFRLGDSKFAKEILKEGLVNTPSKLSRMFIVSLSVILLASFGVSSSDIGIFYMAMMISVIGGGFASSMAFMAIPASSKINTDLSSGSMRISLSFTAPIIVALLVAPRDILSIIGDEYASAEILLFILSISILPAAIVTNAISKFNNIGKQRKILVIGLLQLVGFLASFFILVPQYGTIGAAISVLMAFIIASVPSALWIERQLMRYVVVSCISIIIGGTVGYAMNQILGIYSVIAVMVSVAITLIIIIALKNTSVNEISSLVKMMNRK